jgi:uncharacterized membrane protein YhaH (DUF805 family)
MFMEGCIFINYRRRISGAAAGRLTDRLVQHFDHERLFMDVDGIEPGVDFVKALDDQVARCIAFLAVIGPGWSDLKNAEGQRRLDQPDDHVRVEIESALKRDIRVIPVLVDGASMPTAEELPDSLKPLSRRNAVTLSHHRFGSEVDELARVLQRTLELRPKSAATCAFVARDAATPSWIDFLFSFEGRISRKSFWLSGLAIMGVCFLVMAGLAAVLGKDALDSQKGLSSKLLSAYTVATLAFYWPAFALYLKRLHDFGQGTGGLWPVVILSVLDEGLSFANFDIASQVVAAVLIGVFVFVGCVKGTPGPNQYGPDPLANITRRSAT